MCKIAISAAVYDDEGNLITPEISQEVQVEIVLPLAAGSRYGLRYEEALCLEAAKAFLEAR